MGSAIDNHASRQTYRRSVYTGSGTGG